MFEWSGTLQAQKLKTALKLNDYTSCKISVIPTFGIKPN